MCIWVGAFIARSMEAAQTTVAAKNPVALVIVCYLVGFRLKKKSFKVLSSCQSCKQTARGGRGKKTSPLKKWAVHNISACCLFFFSWLSIGGCDQRFTHLWIGHFASTGYVSEIEEIAIKVKYLTGYSTVAMLAIFLSDTLF